MPWWAGDFDGDDKQDVAVGNSNGTAISVMWGNGDGTFGCPRSFFEGVSVRSVVVGDFNADGKQDVALPESLGYSILVLLGNGDGSFQQPVASYAFHGEPLRQFLLVSGDFDRDGKQDLVARNSEVVVQLLRGNGDGTFQHPVLIAGGDLVFLAVRDLNGDGRPDLVMGDRHDGYGAVRVMLSGGDSFQGGDSLFVWGDVNSVAVGDFDGDGRPEPGRGLLLERPPGRIGRARPPAATSACC